MFPNLLNLIWNMLVADLLNLSIGPMQLAKDQWQSGRYVCVHTVVEHPSGGIGCNSEFILFRLRYVAGVNRISNRRFYCFVDLQSTIKQVKPKFVCSSFCLSPGDRHLHESKNYRDYCGDGCSDHRRPRLQSLKFG